MPEELVKEQDMSNLDNLQPQQCIQGSESTLSDQSVENAEKRSTVDELIAEDGSKAEAAQASCAADNNGKPEDEIDESLQFPPFPSGRPRGRVAAPTSAAKPKPRPK